MKKVLIRLYQWLVSPPCTEFDHAILAHYAHFNSDLRRCNRCGAVTLKT